MQADILREARQKLAKEQERNRKQAEDLNQITAQDRQEPDAMIKRAKISASTRPASRRKPPPLSPTFTSSAPVRSAVPICSTYRMAKPRVSGYSGSSSSGAKCDPACGGLCCLTENLNDMFSLSGGPSRRAIVFADR